MLIFNNQMGFVSDNEYCSNILSYEVIVKNTFRNINRLKYFTVLMQYIYVGKYFCFVFKLLYKILSRRLFKHYIFPENS